MVCSTGGGQQRNSLRRAGTKTAATAGPLHVLFTLTTIYTLAALYYVHWTRGYCRSVTRAPGSDGWSWLQNQWPVLLSQPPTLMLRELAQLNRQSCLMFYKYTWEGELRNPPDNKRCLLLLSSLYLVQTPPHPSLFLLLLLFQPLLIKGL